MSDSLYSYVLYSPLNSPGQNTGMGSCSHHQQIFWTQGLNPGLLHCRLILYQLGYWGSPWTLEWVAYPFSRGYSWPRNWTRVSCIAGGWATCSITGNSVTEPAGKNTGVGCQFLFQEIFWTYELNLCLLCFLHSFIYHCTTWESSLPSC